MVTTKPGAVLGTVFGAINTVWSGAMTTSTVCARDGLAETPQDERRVLPACHGRLCAEPLDGYVFRRAGGLKCYVA